MRLALIVWCVIGAGLIGLKAHLDRTLLKYPDVAVRSGAQTYLIPRAMLVSGDEWRANMMRLAGCWDVREAGVVRAAAVVADCDGARALHLKVPAQALGPGAEVALRGQPIPVTFWTAYAPPGEHLAQLQRAWLGQGEWTGRRVIARDDWQVVQVVSANSPWVQLLAGMPVRGDARELASLYEGRCYRPEPLTDVGATCAVAVRVGAGAVVEYVLGPDEVSEFPAIHQGLVAEAQRWLQH